MPTLTLTITLDSLGKALRHTRIAAGLSTAYMAQQIGVSERTVGKWERDEHPPDKFRLVLRMWAELVGVEPDFFEPLVTEWNVSDLEAFPAAVGW